MTGIPLKLWLFCTLLLFGLSGMAQTEYVTFQVKDNRSNDPVVFATVILTDSRIGVVADENGFFRIPSKHLSERDSLRISSIGYQTKRFKINRQEELQVIFLKPHVEQLSEVELSYRKEKKRNWSARRVVKEALRSIDNNYPVTPYGYMAYYRDYQLVTDSTYYQFRNISSSNDYLNLSEALVHVYDSGFGTNRYDDPKYQTVLYNYRLNPKFPEDKGLSVPYDNRANKFTRGVIISPLGGNELELLQLTDAIRNYDRMSFSFIHVMEKDLLNNHLFEHDGTTYFEDQEIYKIKFRASVQRAVGVYRANGSIYIDKQDYGIHMLEYQLKDAVSSKLLYRIRISYKRTNSTYYLNYISFNNKFEAGTEDYFKVEAVNYLHDLNAFEVVFNEPIESLSLENWNDKIIFTDSIQQVFYKKKSLDLIGDQRLLIKMGRSTRLESQVNNGALRYTMTGIRDIRGRLLNEQYRTSVDQFREIFVQKVFEDQPLNSDFQFIDKKGPLSQSKNYQMEDGSPFWTNTPLKSIH